MNIRINQSLLFLYIISYFSFCSIHMQKHNEWVSNRGYIQHLEVLTKIGSRKPHTTPLKQHHPLPHHHQSIEHLQPKPQQQTASHHAFSKCKENLTMREQQILWDNYYLGKRIIETPPVISKRKFEAQYLKHKRLVECLTASQSKKIVSTQFRVKKLRQYKQNIQQFTQEVHITTVNLRNSIRLTIKSLAFYRQSPTLDQLNLLFIFFNKEGRRMKQKSDNFPAQKLLQRAFYFNLPRRLAQKQQALSIQIRNCKGLDEISLGYFTIPSATLLETYTAQIFHCGKLIGEAQLSASYGKREGKREGKQM